MRVAIVGTGWVGLVSGACFAAKGHEVVCVDLDAERVAQINRAQAPFFEPSLEELLEAVVEPPLTADSSSSPHQTGSSSEARGGERGRPSMSERSELRRPPAVAHPAPESAEKPVVRESRDQVNPPIPDPSDPASPRQTGSSSEARGGERGRPSMSERSELRRPPAVAHPAPESAEKRAVSEPVPGTLKATQDLADAVRGSQVVLLAVGTPFDGERIDLGQVRAAAQSVGQALAASADEVESRVDYPLVIVKSTVLPGTTDGVVRPILEAESGLEAGVDFGVAANPEFLREGQAVADFMEPDRVVMGGIDERCWQIQEELYADFPCPDQVRTSNATAEMIKYTSNSLLANLISFSNEIGNLCATLPGVDVKEVMGGLYLDKRLSPLLTAPASEGERLRPGILAYLAAGCGFGGSCLPKDVSSLIAFGEERGRAMELLRSAIAINQRQPRELLAALERHLPALEGAPITVLGLAFKPGTDDIRQSPALTVLRTLLERGAQITAWDPAATARAALALEGTPGAEGIRYTDDLETALEGAAALVLVTAWPELGRLPELLAERESPPILVDGRRMLDPGSVPRYDGIGLGS